MPHCSMLKMLTAILLYANNPNAILLYVAKQYASPANAQRLYTRYLMKQVLILNLPEFWGQLSPLPPDSTGPSLSP